MKIAVRYIYNMGGAFWHMIGISRGGVLHINTMTTTLDTCMVWLGLAMDRMKESSREEKENLDWFAIISFAGKYDPSNSVTPYSYISQTNLNASGRRYGVFASLT
jgi:hypothetical protein